MVLLAHPEIFLQDDQNRREFLLYESNAASVKMFYLSAKQWWFAIFHPLDMARTSAHAASMLDRQLSLYMHKSIQLGERAMGFASAAGPSASFKRRMASSNASSTLQRTRTSEIYSQVLCSEAQAQCLVRAGDGLSTTCL
jgi:hypothetical protein